MREFLTLLGQIFFIACLQSVIELFIDVNSRPYQARIMNIACFLGSLYFLFYYITNVLLGQLTTVFRFNF